MNASPKVLAMIEWLKAHLVDDAKDAWRWYSVWASTISGLMSAGWAFVPRDIQDRAPWWIPLVVAGVCFAGPALRVLKQGPKNVA